MILVTVGTHAQPFDRLVAAAGNFAAATGERVVVQRGESRVTPPGCEVHDWIVPDELMALRNQARAIVCHAAPASVYESLEAGISPLVVPRDPRLGEHVDDHQLRWAATLGPEVVVRHTPNDLTALLADAARDWRVISWLDRGEHHSRIYASRLAALVSTIGRKSWLRGAVGRASLRLLASQGPKGE